MILVLVKKRRTLQRGLAPGTAVDLQVGLDHLVNCAILVIDKLDGLQVLGEQERSVSRVVEGVFTLFALVVRPPLLTDLGDVLVAGLGVGALQVVPTPPADDLVVVRLLPRGGGGGVARGTAVCRLARWRGRL